MIDKSANMVQFRPALEDRTAQVPYDPMEGSKATAPRRNRPRKTVADRLGGRQISKSAQRLKPVGLLASWFTTGRALRLAAALAVCTAVAWLAQTWARDLFLEETRERARATLDLYIQSLQGTLHKYEVIPELLAGRREVIELFRNRADPGAVEQANRLTEEVNRTSGAEDIYFMDPSGLTFAASNWARERTFIGGNFSFRPYFQEAMQGRLGRYFALGTTSNKRGYYFAYPVIDGGRTEGVVVVKVNVERIESSLAARTDEFVVTDPNGVIFISSRPDWRFATLGSLTEDARKRIERDRQYRLSDLTPLDLERSAEPDAPFDLVKIGGPPENGMPSKAVEYLVESKPMPEILWTVHVLADTRWARTQITTTLSLSVLACVLALLLFAIANQRRRRLIEGIEIQKSAAERLEQRVRERTADLSASNRRLEQEIAERKATEEALRRTQNELVQAGKLAALGQISAAISHEYNQPLAAIRSYAENTALLVTRNRHKEARENCHRIRDLTVRMGEIGKHLKAFARKPRSQKVEVSLSEVLDDTLALLRSRLESEGVQVDIERPAGELRVLAGPVRLQQVVTNLLLNAMDAMEGVASPRIEIALRERHGAVYLSVRDRGAGIAAEDLPRLFDPFFTTKEVGRGLGLGLSISYNIVKDFQGSLTAENHAEGGAVFTLELPLASAAVAAEG